MKSRDVYRLLQRIAMDAVPETVDLRERVRKDVERRQVQNRRRMAAQRIAGAAALVVTVISLSTLGSVIAPMLRPLQATVRDLTPTPAAPVPLTSYRGIISLRLSTRAVTDAQGNLINPGPPTQVPVSDF